MLQRAFAGVGSLLVMLVSSFSTVIAAPISWADWISSDTSGAMGSFGSIGITYSGPSAFVQTAGGTDYWVGYTPHPYVSAEVDNAPPASDIIALDLGGLKTITFSQAVTDPLMALVSWNSQPSVTFDKQIEIVSTGWGYWGFGTLALNGTGDGFAGNEEVHGVIRVKGTFTSFSFTDNSEGWHGFTIGLGPQDVAEVPEPASVALFSLGGLGLIAARRRRPA